MTDLQMSLIAAGGVFVVGVVTYNKWQEYKARKSVERAFASDHDDVLMRTGEGAPAAERSEPMFDLGMPSATLPATLPANPPAAPVTGATVPVKDTEFTYTRVNEPTLDADAFTVADTKPEPQLDAPVLGDTPTAAPVAAPAAEETPAPVTTPVPAPATPAPPAPAAPATPATPAAPVAPPSYRAAGATAAQDAVAASLPGTRPGMPPAELAECLVDPLIDCMIPLALEAPVRGDKILPTLHGLRRNAADDAFTAFGKDVRFRVPEEHRAEQFTRAQIGRAHV